MRYTGKQLRKDVDFINEVYRNSSVELHVDERDSSIYPGTKWGGQVRFRHTKSIIGFSEYGTPRKVYAWIAETGEDMIRQCAGLPLI